MRRPICLLIACCLFAFALPVLAQDATETGTTPTPEPSQAVPLSALDLDHVARAEAAAEDARRYAGDASSYLGIFESVGVAIAVIVPVLAVIAGIVGFARLNQARTELTRARERVEQELAALRDSVTDELRQKQSELDALKAELEASARDERLRSEQATLALALLPLADRQYHVEDFDGALDTYHRALLLDPNNVVTHYRLGYVYTQIGKLDDATAHLSRALDIEPDFAPAIAALGYVLRRRAESMDIGSPERGQGLAEAELMLRRALALSPKLVDEDGESWWGSLGGLHRRRGQVDDAIDAYERARAVTPYSSYPLGNLAMLYLQKQDRARMLETFRQAERLAARRAVADGSDFWAWADLLVSRLALGKYDEAQDTLEWLLSMAPTDAPDMLQRPLATLRQLIDALDGSAAGIAPFVARIEAHLAGHRTDGSST